jgi:tRNA(fMet)-specific endonuclease VapC
VLVSVERRRARLSSLVEEDDDVAVAAVTAAELLVGIELADGAHRSRRRAFVDAVLEVLPVEGYDLDVARSHARLMAHVRRAGRPRGAHDLLVAATAVARAREVVTTDRDGFAGLPGVELRTLRQP